MIRRFFEWLGTGRARFLFILLAITGLLSLMLNAVQPHEDWVTFVQSLLALAFLIGATLTVITRFDGPERRQVAILLGPPLVALAIGLLFPALFVLTAVLAVGWIAIALLSGRAGVRREYQRAVRLLRKSRFDEAIQVMTDLIKEEPRVADHYRFRAELFRLAGKAGRARADYKKVVELTPDSGVGYNGLAEVYLQEDEYEEARIYGKKALELEPNEWVPAYNLGMIEDRLGNWESALGHLRQALAAKIPDRRHRLLTHLWMARALAGLGQTEEAEQALADLKREQDGLREWEIIFASDQAALLRHVLAADVELAGKLTKGEATVEALRESGNNR